MQGMMLKAKSDVYIRQDTSIRGKWHQKKYEIVKKLGAGMIGTVYLCRDGGRLVALKISKQAMSMTAEVNVLKSLDKLQANIGPRILDVDDWEVAGRGTYSFYVMEYIHGENLNMFMKKNGPEWIGVFLLQLLDQLTRLHDAGWVFGDLKNDNLLVEKGPATIRLIDVGGTTKVGRSIKEYTEFHDRAYWGLGGRKAEPSYDLFALVMVVLKVYYPAGFNRNGDSNKLLCRKITNLPELNLYGRSLQGAIEGKYQTAIQMRNEIMQMLVMQEAQKTKRYRRVADRVLETFLISGVTGIYGMIIYLLF